ncbi:MAG: cytochrome P450 [Chloroflexota bacterium]
MSSPKDLPGPKPGILNIQLAREFQQDPLEFLSRVAREYPSDIIHWKFGPTYDMHLLVNPELIRELIVKQWKSIKKWERMAKVSAKIAGPSNLLIAEGDDWKKTRKMTAPAFHTQRIKEYIDMMVAHTQKTIAMWQDGDTIDIDEAMTTAAMGVIGEILFDIKNIEEDATEFADALKVLLDMFILETTSIMPLPDWVPSPRNLREDAAMKYANKFILNIVKERRASGEDRGDVMSALLQVVDEDDGDGFTDTEVMEQLYILFTAGYETTAALLTWTLYLLAKHPDVQQRLYDEVSNTLQGDSPTLEELEAMSYTDSVLKESMRIYPPVWSLFVREAVEEVTVGEHTFPAGSLFFVSPWVTHHDPNYWESPQIFDPHRFEGDWKDQRPTYSYMPFGGGPRVCIGSHLAEMEAEVILATLVKKFSFELATLNDNVEIHTTVSIRPKDGMRLKIRVRD